MDKKLQGGSPVQLRDHWGDASIFTGSRAWAKNMTTESGDYDLGKQGLLGESRPDYFYIIPQINGVIIVELQNAPEGETYTITDAETDAYLGSALQYRVRKVIKIGTTATFTVII